MKPTVVILCGPTASGKGSLAIDLAQSFPLEIVNADSLQFFRHLDIGSAKPAPEELRAAPHHLIDVLDPDGAATIGWFARETLGVIGDVQARKRIPLLVGGAGFYLQAVEHPPVASPTSFGNDVAEGDYELLESRDPEAARRIHRNDTYRISRAVSLVRQGELPSERWSRAKEGPAKFDTLWIALSWEREELYRRIDLRMERMFRRGLLEETRSVAERFPGALPRLSRAIGYRQALSVLRDGTPPAAALEEAKARSRQYAKRQVTWFRRESRIAWISGKNPFLGAKEALERSLPA